MKRRIVALAVASAMIAAGTTAAAKAPTTWDGLVLTKSKRLETVYLQPGADFRGYTKVIVEPTEIAFAKNWQRDYNRSSVSLGSRISDREVQEAVTKGVTAASDIFSQAWTKGGYEVVSTPGPDVLRVKTGIVNVRVNAPDRQTAGRTHSFSQEAGQATLFVEARDSLTGALLGRAVDPRVIGDSLAMYRDSVTNRGDFRDQVQKWADISVRGVTELKSLSPVKP